MSSPFAKHHTAIVSFPWDPDQAINIKGLAGRHLQRAHDANMMASVDTIKRMGGPRFQKEMQAIGDPAERAKKIKEQQDDPLNAYDQRTLLYKGITGWTYPESLVPEAAPALMAAIDLAKAGDTTAALAAVMQFIESGEYAAVIPAIDDLKDDAAEFLARAILKLTKPGLFLTVEEAKAEQKNG